MSDCCGSKCCCGGSSPVVEGVECGWTLSDWLGALRVRLDLGRMNYAVKPGVYAVGEPDAGSPVMVSANYKLSFDHLRRALKGLDTWILVIDTKGINVWCAAGKGTFGTCVLVSGIESSRLAEIVSHRTLIVPQLGAPGVAAHEVAKASGFNVVYGPVRASDIPAFLSAGMKATRAMRTVEFDLLDRLAVVPVEIVHWAKWLFALCVVCAIAAAIGSGDYSVAGFVKSAERLLLAFAGGVLLGPVLFPWLPGRAFAVKGVFSGLLVVAAMWFLGLLSSPLQLAGWTLITLSVSSFLMLAYTGSSPCTSLSGTRIETKIGFRCQLIALALGLALLLKG